MSEHIITVSQLAKYIKQIFEAEELLFNISVVGEISSLKLVRGVLYFDLKDENALMPCVCFNAENFESIKNGDKIIAKGTPNFYVKGGRLSFNVSKIKPYGIGDIFQQFLILKEKLEKEGLFDNAHKKQIPTDVKKIGVITSETGAVIKDIITVVKRRNSAVNIVLYPAQVQGAGTVQSIIKGLDFFENYDVDLIIIARGGGSAEDLSQFNDETLARRIFAFTKPTISAVGHETDFTICDFVADVRGATPSVAGELAVCNVMDKKQLFLSKQSKVKSLVELYLNNKKRLISQKYVDLNYLITNFFNEKKYTLSLQSAKLEKLNPDNILKRGYSRVEHLGKAICSSKTLDKGDNFEIKFFDGEIKGEVK